MASIGLALVMAAAMVVAALQDAREWVQLAPEKVQLGYTFPTFVTILDAHGEAAVRWVVPVVSQVLLWTTSPERLLMFGAGESGEQFALGDPATGERRLMPKSWAAAGQVRNHQFTDMDCQVRRPTCQIDGLPGGRVIFDAHRANVTRHGEFKVERGRGVMQGNRLVLPSEGLIQQLFASPSGRWTAVIAEAPSSTVARFRMPIDGGEMHLVEIERYSLPDNPPRMPALRQTACSLSPDGRWVVTDVGERRTVVRSVRQVEKQGELETYREGIAGHSVWWRADSSAFVYYRGGGSVLGRGFYLVDRQGAHRLLISGMHAAPLGWYESGFDILSADTHAFTAEPRDAGNVSRCDG